jgi:hypothetical protein
MADWIEKYRLKYRNDPFKVQILEHDLYMLGKGPAAITHADERSGQPGQVIRNILRRNINRRIEVGKKD